MRLDPNPLFRRVITPWYNSAIVCWMVLVAMLLVMLFCWAGIWVGLSHDDFHRHLWLPLLIFGLSLMVFGINFYRMIRRYPEK